MPVLLHTACAAAPFAVSSDIGVVIESVAKELALPSWAGGSAR